MTKKTATGLKPNVAASFSYLGFFVTGIVFYLVEKDNQFIRFHALQSTFAFLALLAISKIPIIGWILWGPLFIAAIIIWLICIIKAWQGEEFLLPFVGQLAKKLSKQKYK